MKWKTRCKENTNSIWNVAKAALLQIYSENVFTITKQRNLWKNCFSISFVCVCVFFVQPIMGCCRLYELIQITSVDIKKVLELEQFRITGKVVCVCARISEIQREITWRMWSAERIRSMSIKGTRTDAWEVNQVPWGTDLLLRSQQLWLPCRWVEQIKHGCQWRQPYFFKCIAFSS